jgi:hypothetical protein
MLTSGANFVEAGWPMPALQGVWFNIPNPATSNWRHQADGAFRARAAWLSRLFPRRAAYIPWHPSWPGFAINSLMHAIVLWILVTAPSALRRSMRIRRGLCVKCAYDLRGRGIDAQAPTICPECGHLDPGAG